MKTRYDVIKLISYHITNGRGIKIELDGCDLRLEMNSKVPYVIWHNETRNEIAAIINEEQDCDQDFISTWAQSKVELL